MLSRPAPDFAPLYEKHRGLVRRVLAKRGVEPVDLDDATQEAFVIVHRLLPAFEGRSSIETWLFAHRAASRGQPSGQKAHGRQTA